MGIYKMRTDFGQHMKYLLGLIAFIFVVGAFSSFGPSMLNRNRQPSNPNAAQGPDILATANGVEIKRTDFETAFDKYNEDAQQKGMRSALTYADARAKIFGGMVENAILLTTAQQMSVDLSQSAIDTEIDRAALWFLSQNRKQLLKKVDKKEDDSDPRTDKKYLDALTARGLSLQQVEDMAKSKMTSDRVEVVMAEQGIEQKLLANVKRAGAKDVRNSYNVYKLRQIVLPKGPGPVPAQIKTKAEKIEQAARSGGDFAKLATDNSVVGAKSGGAAVYSWDSRQQFAPAVRDAVEKLKPGEISPVIDEGRALVIVKLESVTPELPEIFDQGVQTKRADDINKDRQSTKIREFQQTVFANPRVQINDPEFLAYWEMGQAHRAASMGDVAQYQKSLNIAVSSLKKSRSVFAGAKLADLEAQEGKVKEAIDLLWPMLEGSSPVTEGVDMRILLGGLFEQQSKDPKLSAAQRRDLLAKAIAQYKVASDVARSDISAHQQLQAKFKQLNQPELAAKETELIAQLKQREAEVKARNRPWPRECRDKPAPRQGQ